LALSVSLLPTALKNRTLRRVAAKKKESSRLAVLLSRHAMALGYVFGVVLPVILRITFCLAMWTLGVMTITIAEARTPDQRVAPQTRTSDPGAEKLQISGDVAHKMGCRLRSEEISRDCQD